MDTPQPSWTKWLGRTFLAAALSASSLGNAVMAEEGRAIPQWRTAQVRFPGQSAPITVSYEVKDGWAIFEGDVLLGRVDAAGTCCRPNPTSSAQKRLSLPPPARHCGHGP